MNVNEYFFFTNNDFLAIQKLKRIVLTKNEYNQLRMWHHLVIL